MGVADPPLLRAVIRGQAEAGNPSPAGRGTDRFGLLGRMGPIGIFLVLDLFASATENGIEKSRGTVGLDARPGNRVERSPGFNGRIPDRMGRSFEVDPLVKADSDRRAQGAMCFEERPREVVLGESSQSVSMSNRAVAELREETAIGSDEVGVGEVLVKEILHRNPLAVVPQHEEVNGRRAR